MLSMEDLFKVVMKEHASDLLIVAKSPPVIRVNGELKQVTKTPLTSVQTRELLFSILTDEQKRTFEKEKAVDFGFSFWQEGLVTEGTQICRFRVNVFQQQNSVSGAFRTITNQVPPLEQLGLPPVVKEWANLRQGLVIATGPTGHGKSTTLAAIVDLINSTRSCHIITVEDPIEYLHPHKKSIVEQREIGQDATSFASALKHVLRQDPDIILVGEMRDRETISCALTAAETGHLVLTTLHTNDSVQTIDRLIDVFPPEQQRQIRIQLAMSLSAVIAQRLLPTVDRKRRVVACEILLNHSAVANLIREEKTHQIYNVMETRTKEGMMTFDQSLEHLYRLGLISFEEAIAHMKTPEKFKRTTMEIQAQRRTK